MEQHEVVSREQWLTARIVLLREEKELTRQRDRLSAKRRALPWVRVEKNYVFDSVAGPRTLADLFDGRSQLVVQHFMMGPDWKEGCVGCSFGADHVEGARMHLEHHDVSFAAVSRAPIAAIESFRTRMGWRFAWVSSLGNEFNFDYHVSFPPDEVANGGFYNFQNQPIGIEELPGMSVFHRNDSGEIFHTYSAYGRGTEGLLTAYFVLDMTPKGRDETIGGNLTDWVRHHDRYGEDASCCHAANGQ